jgi:hypothetical protein
MLSLLREGCESAREKNFVDNKEVFIFNTCQVTCVSTIPTRIMMFPVNHLTLHSDVTARKIIKPVLFFFALPQTPAVTLK